MVLDERAAEARDPTALEQVLRACMEMDGYWVLAGDSAGGGVALAATMRMRDSGMTMPQRLLLSSP